MGGAERVVDVDVGKRGQLLCELGVVLLLAFVETDVLKHHDVAVVQRIGGILDVRADYVAAQCDVAPNQFLQALGDGGKAERLLEPFACGAATVARQYDARSVAHQLFYRRKRSTQARVVRDVAVGVHRRVEVDAYEHLLALRVQLVDGSYVRH